MSGKELFIDAAINGTTTKDYNPSVPRTVSEISADILACFEAGATVVHNHQPDGARDSTDVEGYASCWVPVLDELPWAQVYPTIGTKGGFAERFGHVVELGRRWLTPIAPIDPGSLNFGALAADGAPAPVEFVYENSYAYIDYQLDQCRMHRLIPTFSIFEPTFLHAVVAYWRAGRVPAGAWLKVYLGGHGGYPGTAHDDAVPAPSGCRPPVLASTPTSRFWVTAPSRGPSRRWVRI
jgi:3-keto-5-aminohexanoate cleavage enzyme